MQRNPELSPMRSPLAMSGLLTAAQKRGRRGKPGTDDGWFGCLRNSADLHPEAGRMEQILQKMR